MAKLILGCGYLGQRVAALWQTQGARVVAATRQTATAEAFRLRGWSPLVCDVLRPETLTQLPRVSTVLYCVGLDRSAGQSMRDVYVTGLAHVLDYLPSPERFLYISSTSVYGQCDGEWVDETAVTEPTDESGRVVREAEQLLQQRLPQAVILRFAGIYGPGRLMLRHKLEAGEPLHGDPDKWLNLIHVEDGAAAVLAAEQFARAGAICNISDDRPIHRGIFYTHMAHVLGLPPPRFLAPDAGAAPVRNTGNRRISNRKMHEELRLTLRYPDYEVGLPASV